MTKVHIALLLMCKNETKRLHITLNSVVGHVDSIVAFDTGSTDNTIEILKEFSEKHNIPLRLKQGEFVDFAVSRNESLDFADSFEDVEYLLLMDVNDELKGGEELRKTIERHKATNSPSTAYLVCQEWWSGQYDKYYNMRFIKAHCGWRYKGSVHEYLENFHIPDQKDRPPVVRLDDTIKLYQDRTQDDDKSFKRFSRDKVFLLKDHEKDPKDARTLFYLAQTCSCLNELEEAYKYYMLRAEIDGFMEEKFHAVLRSAEITQKLNKDWDESLVLYMRAFEIEQRVEPLIKIAEHYRMRKQWVLGYNFAYLACQLPFPSAAILFIDKHAYQYKRWHLLGILGWYAEKYPEGKIGCINAIKMGLNNELDTSNLKFYEEREAKNEPNISTKLEDFMPVQPNYQQPPSSLQQVQPEQSVLPPATTLTKNQFIQKIIAELNVTNPNLSQKQKASRANVLWKCRKTK
jgi:glycosyltransferase involved in cell wall biosynthesis